MPIQDFKISYTWTVNPSDISSASQSIVGEKSSILFIDDSVATFDSGPQANFAGIVLLTTSNVGAKATLHFIDDSVATFDVGAQSNFAGIQLVTQDNTGPKSTIFFYDESRATFDTGPASVFESGQFSDPVAEVIDNLVNYDETSAIIADLISMRATEVFPDIVVGTWLQSGVKKLLIDWDSGGTLDVNQSQSVNVNTSAAGAVTITLPTSATLGTQYDFVRTSANNFEVQPGGADDIEGFTSVTLDSIGAKLTVISDGAGAWAIANRVDVTTS